MKGPYKGKFKVTQEFKGSAHDGLDLVGLTDKKIYSTVNGTVERAGWENSQNKKQGFGLYVRIKQSDSVDRYYFGHLSEIAVKTGQTVKAGDLLGTEGSTGNSTGSHCHYCVRGNASKAEIKDVCAISGIPNKIGTYESSAQKKVSELAEEVIKGIWGNGEERRKKLSEAGYDPDTVQQEVNRLLGTKSNSTKKSVETVAKEVIAGKWGNGSERKQRLTSAGYDYNAVQQTVNRLLK